MVSGCQSAKNMYWDSDELEFYSGKSQQIDKNYGQVIVAYVMCLFSVYLLSLAVI